MNKKGMEAWVMVGIALMLLIIIFVIIVIGKASNESGSILEKIFNLF